MTQTFNALVLTNEEKVLRSDIRQLTVDDLPAGDVLVAVSHSSLNFKDAMALTGTGKIIRQFPMVPGIDFVGRVVESASPDWKAGDAVILTGWGVGERFWGGYSQMQRVKSEWLVPLPESMSPEQAMTIGTAGLTAMLSVMALHEAGLLEGKVLVTGASGGVGSVAVALLAGMGYEVVALSSRPEKNRDYLAQLGAREVLALSEWQTAPAALGTQRWDGVVDVVGGAVLAQALSEIRYAGVAAISGLAGSTSLETTVMPFILRGIRLQGVDSVMCPIARRNVAWQRLSQELSSQALQEIQSVVGLADLPALAKKMMAGQAHGRVLVDLQA